MKKYSNKQITDIISKAYKCLANKTTLVVNRYRFDADCSEQICSLYSLVLMIRALERWEQYGDGTPKSNNCITSDDVSSIINSINKSCKDDCNTSITSVISEESYLEFSQENGLYILI